MEPVAHNFRILLTDDELGLSAIDDLAEKYYEWLRVSKETTGVRKTRAANRRADQLYNEIMSVKQFPRIGYKDIPTTNLPPNQTNPNSSKSSSIDEDSSGVSSGCGRTLRPRTRTPSITRGKTSSCPSTPRQQNLRYNMRKNENVLSAALNQQHPSVSVTKIRELMRADSAQKKLHEEKERQEKLRLDRKAKEERAEQHKKKMLEERATAAKMKREQRLLHAAELRKAREKSKQEQKLREDQARKAHKTVDTKTSEDIAVAAPKEAPPPLPAKPTEKKFIKPAEPSPIIEPTPTVEEQQDEDENEQVAPVTSEPVRKLNETYQNDNIEISVADETRESHRGATAVAAWAKSPYLREALIKQFSRTEEELRRLVFQIFQGVPLPVNLYEIFGESLKKEQLHRTSSAVWTSSPYRALKRTSSMVLTPTNPKR